MNKKFIEFMKRTIWRWSKSEQCFITYIYDPKIQLKLAKPEDLLGWQISFAYECLVEYYKEYGMCKVYADMTVAVKKLCNATAENFEAVDAAWNIFIELIEA